MNQPINHQAQKRGFTLIELMLAMTFVSVLLMGIAMTVIQMATIYNRGMTVKEVNQAARDISDDMRRSVAASEVFIVNTDGSESDDSIIVTSGAEEIGGRLCTGTFSYLWNYSEHVEADTNNDLTRVLNAAGVAGESIQFVKIPDTGKKYCQRTGVDLTHKNIVYADTQAMTNLLDAGDHDLGVLKIAISTADSAYDTSTGQRTYLMNYIIGTGETSAMDLTNYECLPPGTEGSNLTYCNVQSFSIVLRVGSAVN
jgi:prepilin-type N-terminal cleavage/methylation domain-containing protein